MICETCRTDKDLLLCVFEDGQRYFCPENMVEHLESAHKDIPAAGEIAKQIRASLRVAEVGLLQLSKLTPYQATVFVGLTQAVQPPYSDDEALKLIKKHEKLIAERERRRFEPYATARAIVEAETSRAADPARRLDQRLAERFAEILYSWQHPPTLNAPTDADLEARQKAIRYYFAFDAMAHHILSALVATAMQSFEWEQLSIPERQRRKAEQERAIRDLLGMEGESDG